MSADNEMIASSGNDGFTLIEVLIAFAIMGVVLSIILPIMSGHVLRSNDLTNRSIAQQKLQSLMAEVGLSRPLQEGNSQGSYNDGFSWSLRIDQYGTDTDGQAWGVSAFTVTGTVSWTVGNRSKSVELVSLKIARGEGNGPS